MCNRFLCKVVTEYIHNILEQSDGGVSARLPYNNKVIMRGLVVHSICFVGLVNTSHVGHLNVEIGVINTK